MEGTANGRQLLSISKFKTYHRGFTALKLSQANAFMRHECLFADRASGLPLADGRRNQAGQGIQGDKSTAAAVSTNSRNGESKLRQKGKRSTEAIRKKRLRRNKMKKEALQQKNMKKQQYIARTQQLVQTMTAEVAKLAGEKEKEKKLTVLYFNKYMAEKKKEYSSPKHIDRSNLQGSCDAQSFLGKGAFGSCSKMKYKGIEVAVKFYEDRVTRSDVNHEASTINLFDHPGLPLLFGVCLDEKPYLMVTQFYGIGGKCTTLWDAVKSGNIKFEKLSQIFKEMAAALLYIHNKFLLHNDIKGDNIVLTDIPSYEHPVLIDFGKCRKLSNAKWYKLSETEKARYYKEHSHLAPGLICGTHCQSFASDVYSYGYLMRQCCKWLKLDGNHHFNLLAKSCLVKNPNDRPTVDDILCSL